MVVLTRPRSAHKAQPKLSVPPPLNLPSLRKEQRFDILGSGTGSVAGGVPGVGTRPATSGLGWSKPSNSAVGSGDRDGASQVQSLSSENSVRDQLNLDGSSKSGIINRHTSPSFVPGSAGSPSSVPIYPDKTLNLRGEDFPSLKATLVSTNGPVQKQKDGLHQKPPVQGLGDELSTMQKDGSHLSSPTDMHPRFQPFQPSLNRGSSKNGSSDNHSLNSSQLPESARRQNNYFPGPLPLVSLSLRSDWADDERDVSHGFTEHAKAEHSYSKTESYLEKDFGFPRVGGILPDKLSQNHLNRRAHQDDSKSIKILPSEVPKSDIHSEGARVPVREAIDGSSWKAPFSKDGLKTKDFAESGGIGSREKNYAGPQGGGFVKDDHDARYRDSTYGRNNTGYGQGARQNHSNLMETSNRRPVEQNSNYGYGSGIDSNKYKGNSSHSSSVMKSSFSANNGAQTRRDFGSDKRNSSRGEKVYMRGWGGSDFDELDSFSSDPFGVVKRKKDVGKQVDFHDPIRESFEAELERVQKMQEQERQRIIEEQERAMEMAQREEEEKQRVAREQEEHRIRLEEEAREAAWREEQEKLQSIRIAEELKVAREEEKRRIEMEEERRKQAARQKLQELEEKIARRQAEAAKAGDSAAVADERISVMPKDKTDDLGSPENSERITDRIFSSMAPDSSTQNRPSYVDFRGGHPLRDEHFVADREKPSSMRRNVFDDDRRSAYLPHGLENGDCSPKNNAWKKYYSGNGYLSSSASYRDNFPEPVLDNFQRTRASRLNFPAALGSYGSNKELDSEFHEGYSERSTDNRLGHGHTGVNFQASHLDCVYQNPELDELYGYGKPRFNIKQPRVLPPPSLALYDMASLRVDENAGRSTYDGSRVHNGHTSRTELPNPTYADGKQDLKEIPDIPDGREEIEKIECQDLKGSSACRCDSQSSISVSSPPHSPAHISQTDLNDSGDYPVETTSPESNQIYPSGKVSVVLSTNSKKESPVNDDEDDDWPVIRNEELQQQEEYDEDNDGYHEDEEVLVRDDENADLAQELEGLRLEGKNTPIMTDNMVIGFDQGVEVGVISDEYETNQLEEENLYVPPPVSVSVLQKPVSSDGMQDDGPTLQFSDDSHTIPSDPPGMQNTVQDFASHSDPHPSSSSSGILNSANATSGSVLPPLQPVPTSMDNFMYPSWPAIVSSCASEQSSAEAPVKLQFGLFSGPSLIPSPIPAIQIGSIRMPLQLHPHVGPSLTHMHSAQPPLFQFGQLRYPSPISQGPMPSAPQLMTFNPPEVPTTYTLNHNPGPPLHLLQGGASSGFGKDSSLVASVEKQVSDSPKLSSSQVVVSKEANSDAGGQRTGNNNIALQQTCSEMSNSIEKVSGVEYSQKIEVQRSQFNNTRSKSSVAGASEGLLRARFQGKGLNGPPPAGQMTGNNGRRFSFIAKNSVQKPSAGSMEASGFEANGFQRKPRRGVRRMEFRVRSTDKKQPVIDMNADNEQVTESFSRGSLNHGVLADRSKQTNDSGNFSSKQANFHGTSSTRRVNKKDSKDSSHFGESSLKRNISYEYDDDAPLQSGVVRIFNQPGIEVPSDENDFIEVRSKRQMLNNRREQREKEIKANSNKNKKVMRKHSSIPPSTQATFNTAAMPLNREVPNAIYAHASQKHGVQGGRSTGFGKVSQPLAPIGTPCVNSETPSSRRSDNIKPTVEPSCNFDLKKKSLDCAQTSLGSWSSQHNHEVMPLTQSQFDEAMKPARFNMTPISDGHLTRPVSKPCGSASSMLLKDSSFQAATNPINSLLAGEKIQFGAVTSPTVFPPASDQAVSRGIRSFGSSRPDLQNPQRVGGDMFLFQKEKKAEDSSSTHLADCEAEAQAAAAAVAAAAIGNDEVVGNANSASTADTKKIYGGTVADGISFGGVAGGHQPTSESKAKEPLSVSLPADLSVEMPSMSIWPPLPSPQSSSSSQMLCPFPGVTPSRLPFYDTNPVMGGPVFAYGPSDEAVSSQSQPQNSNTSGPGPVLVPVPLGTWQQCHSGMDSFYGPPTGYPGGIGAQGPTPMVIYNHFAPVGQVGQVGLSYYGTYVPSSKPDRNHATAPAPGGGGASEGDMNMLSPQHHPAPPSMPLPSAQHLAPRSPLLSTPSPMAMFDFFPFQSSTNMAVQAHWSHGPPPPLHSVLPQTMPLPQQPGGGAMVPPLNHSLTGADNDSRAPPNRNGSKPQTPSPDEKNVDAELAAPSAHIWNEARLVEDLRNSSACSKTSHATIPQEQGVASLSKNSVHPKRLAGGHQYNQQRGTGSSSSQKNRGMGVEWSNNRKAGFHGRSHSAGGEKGFIPGKMKQIYVAKRSSVDGSSTNA